MTIASQQAVTASPISAATVALLGLLSGAGIRMEQILLISVPSTFLGCILGALSVMWKGRELDQDPIYQGRLAKGLIEEPVAVATLDGAQLRRARGSVIVFLAAAVFVVVLGLSPSFRPSYPVLSNGQEAIEQLEMAPAIMIVMLAAAGVNTLLFRASPAATVKGSLMNAGVVALLQLSFRELRLRRVGGRIVFKVTGNNSGETKPCSFRATLKVTPSLLRTTARARSPLVHLEVETGRTNALDLLDISTILSRIPFNKARPVPWIELPETFRLQ